jgi:amino acid transporter
VPEESKEERIDRELIELLNELRVALPGVQVLFAFLLTVPFSNGFPKLGRFDRDVYFVAFIATAVSTVLLIAPSSYHRLRWRQHDKERMLIVSNFLTIAGLAALAVAITATVFMITDFVFHRAWASTFTAMVAGLFLVFWYGLPLGAAIQDRRKSRRSR